MNCETCKAEKKELLVLTENNRNDRLWLCPKCEESVISKIKVNNATMLDRCLKAQKVPPRYHAAKLEKKYCAFEGFDKVHKGQSGLYLCGESGVGKSWLMIAWMKYLLAKGEKCGYIDWSDFMVDLRMDIKDYTNRRGALLQYNYLFIDDFDTSNQYMYDIVYNFVNALYNEGKIVFFTSVDLPAQSKIAMRISEMTQQLHIIRR